MSAIPVALSAGAAQALNCLLLGNGYRVAALRPANLGEQAAHRQFVLPGFVFARTDSSFTADVGELHQWIANGYADCAWSVVDIRYPDHAAWFFLPDGRRVDATGRALPPLPSAVPQVAPERAPDPAASPEPRHLPAQLTGRVQAADPPLPARLTRRRFVPPQLVQLDADSPRARHSGLVLPAPGNGATPSPGPTFSAAGSDLDDDYWLSDDEDLDDGTAPAPAPPSATAVAPQGAPPSPTSRSSILACKPVRVLMTRTADELEADVSLATDVEWIVHGLIPKGGVTMLYGIGKGGKSTLAAHVVACIVSGRPCLTRAVATGEVLWLDLEQHLRLTRRKMIQAGAVGHAHKVHIYNGRAPTLSELEATIIATRASIVVIDSLSRFLGLDDECDNAEITKGLDPLVALAHRLDVALLVIHHDRKSPGAHGRAIRGGSAFLAVVDVALHLQRAGDSEDGRRRLEGVARYDEANISIIVRQTADGYVVDGNPTDVRRADLLAALGDDELDAEGIAARVEHERQTVVPDLRALLKEGKLVRTGAGKKGDPYRYRRFCILSETLSSTPSTETASEAA